MHIPNMTINNYDVMSLNELRQHVLKHREDIIAFQKYIDRSKFSGRMICIDPSDNEWEESITDRIQRMLAEGNSEQL
jgi:hypothetical protein